MDLTYIFGLPHEHGGFFDELEVVLGELETVVFQDQLKGLHQELQVFL